MAQDEESLPITEVLVSDPKFSSRLLRGFYDGAPGWKWTGQSFAISVDPPEPPQRTLLYLDFTVPDELLLEVKTVTLTAKVNGAMVARTEYTKTGRYRFRQEVPQNALKRKPAEVEFSLDKAAKAADGHPIGLIAVSVSLSPLEPKPLERQTAVKMARAGYREIIQERNKGMSPEKQTELIKLFHELPVWKHTWFQNVEIEKNPLDLWMMQQIIYEIQPDFVLEMGTWHGGSGLYWAHTLNGMGLESSRVITVDIENQTQTAAVHPLWKKYVTFLRGSSTDPRIVQQIAQTVKGRKVIVTLDSDHTMKHVLDELHTYAPMVSRGSYLVVEDTHMDGVPTYPDFGPGPMAAVRRFLTEPEGKEFEPDLKREAMIMTFNPGGWLRRK